MSHQFLGRSDSLERLSDMFVEPDAHGSNAGAPTGAGDEPPRTSFGRARSVSAGSEQARPIDSRYSFRRVEAPLREPGKSGSGSSLCFLFRELISVSSMGGIVDGWKEKAAYGGSAALQTLDAVGKINIGVATASAIISALTVSLFFDALPPLEASIEDQRAATARTFQDRSGRLAYLVLIATSAALALGGMLLAGRNSATASTCRPHAAAQLLASGAVALAMPLRFISVSVSCLCLAGLMRLALALGVEREPFWVVGTVFVVVMLTVFSAVLQGVDAVLIANGGGAARVDAAAEAAEEEVAAAGASTTRDTRE